MSDAFGDVVRLLSRTTPPMTPTPICICAGIGFHTADDR